jgi:hypothetical protein
MGLYYVIMLFVLWGLAFWIIALPPRAVRIPGYDSWVDCTSFMGKV